MPQNKAVYHACMFDSEVYHFHPHADTPITQIFDQSDLLIVSSILLAIPSGTSQLFATSLHHTVDSEQRLVLMHHHEISKADLDTIHASWKVQKYSGLYPSWVESSLDEALKKRCPRHHFRRRCRLRRFRKCVRLMDSEILVRFVGFDCSLGHRLVQARIGAVALLIRQSQCSCT